MSKNTFLNNNKLDKTHIAFICILGMMTGFLVNQVVLSISMFFFCVNAVWGVHPRRWLENRWWLLGLAWMAFIAASYFWSDDKVHWERSLQVKLPLLLYPVACSFMPPFSKKQLQWITLLTGAALLAGVGYSISFLVMNPSEYIWQYRFSHLLPTPCSQDHLRFSISIALYIMWCVYIWRYFEDRFIKWSICIVMVLLVVYLHILAAKSGLIAFYLFLAAWGIYMSFVRRKIAGIIVLTAIPLFLLFAIRYIPTFRARKDYIGYAWVMLRIGDRSGKYGDLNRLMSYKLAIAMIREHPWKGIGTGNMMNEMKKGYEKYYPQVEDKARLLPHDEFLIIALGCGIPAMLVFTAWVLYPLTWLRKKGHPNGQEDTGRQSFFFFIVWLILLMQLLIEPILEVQYGVFVYFFFLLWFRQQLPDAGAATE